MLGGRSALVGGIGGRRSGTAGTGGSGRSSARGTGRRVRGSETKLLLNPVEVVTCSAVGLLGFQGSIIGGLGILVTSLGGSRAICAGDRVLSSVTGELCAMLAGEGNQLIALGPLRDLDAVLVEPFLNLAVRPGVEKGIGEGGLSSGGRSRCRGLGGPHGVSGKARVATDRGDELVAGAGLGSRVAALVKPGLEVRLRPRLIEPVAGVSCRLANLVGSSLVVLACSLEERVTSARLGARNAMAIKESLELRVGPAAIELERQQGTPGEQPDLRIEDPVLDVVVGTRRLILGFVPVRLHRRNQAVLVLLGTLLGLLALGAQVGLELLRVPAVVGLGDLGVPVVLDKVLQILAIGGGGIGDVVVREPALELGLMPLVVGCGQEVRGVLETEQLS